MTNPSELHLAGRFGEALGAIDADDPARQHTRAAALLALGMFAEAEPVARRAVDFALAGHPELAPDALLTLALIGQATGDPDAGEHFALATELRTGEPDALAQEGMARFALGAGTLDEAERLFAAAGRRYRDLGLGLRVARCLVGQASVAVRRTRLNRAYRLLREAVAVLKDTGDDHALIECHLAHGELLVRARFRAQGENSFLEARALATKHRAWHQVARIDARRAQNALDSIGRLTRKATRADRLRSALNLALPAALATDAIRHRFAPGPARERWVRSVADPVLALSLRIVAELGWTELVMELVENKAASVALDTNPSTVDVVELTLCSPYPPPQDDVELPYAASALVAGGRDPALPGAGFAVPPRVLALPDGDSLLEPWIDTAQERYHLDVRSDEVVTAW